MRERPSSRFDRPVDPAGLGPSLERRGLVSSLEAEDRKAILMPDQRAASRLPVRTAAVVKAPVAGIGGRPYRVGVILALENGARNVKATRK